MKPNEQPRLFEPLAPAEVADWEAALRVHEKLKKSACEANPSWWPIMLDYGMLLRANVDRIRASQPLAGNSVFNEPG